MLGGVTPITVEAFKKAVERSLVMERERERGGWQPVLNKRRSMVNSKGKQKEIVTVFVDNLPESMYPKKLFDMFSKFGVVTDVFIPNKRRKRTRSRFGFVRYDCHVAAGDRKSVV